MGSITNGTVTSFGNTPQAQDDLIYATTTKLAEDSTTAVYLDVMANDLAGNAKILYSLDDGVSAGGIRPTDLLTQDLGRIESASCDFSAHGAHIWITSDGKVGYDPSTWLPTFKAQLDALGAGQYLTDTFTYAIRMANGALSWAIATVQIAGKNDAPAIDLDQNDSSGTTGSGYHTSFTENGTAVAIADLDVTITDVDSANLASATVTLTNAKAGDSLAVLGALPAGITAVVDSSVPGVITVTLTGSASLAGYQTALKQIVFSNSSDNPDTTQRNVTVVVNDGAADSNTASVKIDVVAVNDAPALDLDANNSSASGAGFAATFTENGAAVSIADLDVTITDPDDTNIESATIKLLNAKADDSLDIGALPAGILGAVDTSVPGVITVTLTGSASLADYQAALKLVTFSNGSENPDTTPRDISVVVNDGDADSNVAHATITVIAVNDAPTSTDDSVTTDEDTAVILGVGDFGGYSDVEGDSFAAVKITALPANGSLEFLSGATWVAVTIGQEISEADLSAGKLRFVPDLDENGSAYTSIGFKVGDGTDFSTDSYVLTLDVTAVNDAPVNTVPGAQSVDEDTALAFAGLNTISVSDVDVGETLGGKVEVSLSVEHGSLALGTTTGLSGDLAGGDGTLKFQGTLADVNAALASLGYQGDLNFNGSDALKIDTSDLGNTGSGGIKIDSDTVAIAVTSVNDAPAGADATMTTDEDTAYVFQTSDFGFTDPADGNNLLAVKISTLPVSGALLLNGSPVSASDFISAADIAAGKLTFAPAADANGAGYAGFTFQVQDDGGTLNGGVDLDPVANTITIDVTSVNDAPAGADNTVTTDEDTAYVFQIGDFGFTDPADGNSLLAVKISTLPLAGTLLLDGSPVSADDFVSAADIGAGKLTFEPAANANGAGYAGFTFQVQDDGGIANGGVDLDPVANTLTIDVTSVNDAPAGADKTVTMLEDGVKTFAAADFGFSDVNDSPANNFAGIVVSALPGAGTLKLDGVSVSASDFITAADIIAGKLTFEPTSNANGASYASFTFQVRDDGGAANGGQNTDASPNTLTIDVTAVNDAPVNAIPGAQSVNEDTTLAFTGPNAISVSDVDVGGGKLEVSLAVDNGSLALTTTTGLTFGDSDGSDGTLKFQGTQADVNAALASLSYKGDLNFNGSDTLTILTNDLGNTGVDPGLTDGPGAEQDKDTIAITVNAVNDAPASTDDLVTTNEDTTVILGLTDFGIYFDVEGTPIAAVKITTLESNGSLEYFNGAIWAAVTPDQVISAADISGGNLRFVPDANENGSPYAAVGFKVSDGTDFSAAAYTLTVNVAAINDAPVNTVPGAQSVSQATATGVSGISVSDVDLGSSPIKITLSDAHGNLTLGTTTGLTFSDAQGDHQMVFTGTLADVNAALGTLKYTSDAGYTGSDTITLTSDDQGATGSGGAQIDTDTIAVTVNATNHAPTDLTFSVLTPTGNSLPSGTIGTFATTDPDVGDTFVYSLEAGSSAGFSFSGNALTGSVSDNSIYTFNVLVQDHGGLAGSLSYHETFNIITGTNAADNPEPTGGAGNATLVGEDVLYGRGDDDFIYGGSGNDTLFGQQGSDHLYGGLGSDLLVGGGGNDVFVYETLGDGIDTIGDLDAGSSTEKLDISAVLDLAGNTWTDGKDLSFAIANGFISLTNNGGDTQVNVDIDGAGAGFASTALVVLTGVNPATAATDLADNIVLG